MSGHANPVLVHRGYPSAFEWENGCTPAPRRHLVAAPDVITGLKKEKYQDIKV
jgi:hypothetical protein